MRVLYLAPPSRTPDRLARYSFLEEEIYALAGAGIALDVLTLDARTTSRHASVTTHLVPGWRGLDAGRTAAFAVRQAGTLASHRRSPVDALRAAHLERVAADVVSRHAVDVIHSHFAWPKGLGGLMAAAATRRPLIASFRGTDLQVDDTLAYGRRRDPFFDRSVRMLLRRANRLVFFSEHMRRLALALGAPADRTVLVRKGVAVDDFRPADDRRALKQSLALPDRPLLLSVAGLIPLKGIDLTLRALAPLAATHAFTFVVCGDGPERDRLQQLTQDLALIDRVRFTGKVPRTQVREYFAAADLFLFASVLDSSPNVVMEAMAAGCPIVCLDGGGAPEYVQSGKTGAVVPPGSPSRFTGAIAAALDDPGMRERWGAEARRWALAEFGYTRMIGDYIRMYQDVAVRPKDRQR